MVIERALDNHEHVWTWYTDGSYTDRLDDDDPPLHAVCWCGITFEESQKPEPRTPLAAN